MANWHSPVAADSNGIGIVEETGITSSNGRAEGTMHVTVDGGSLAAGGATLTEQQSQTAVLGTTNGTAVITDANGTIQQYLRGLVKRWVDALGAGTAAAALRTTHASDDPMVTLLGGTGSLKDNHAGWTTIIGVAGIPVISADLTTRTAVTSAPVNKLVVTDIIVSADTAMSVLFEEETSNDDKLKIFLPANGSVQITPRGKLKLAVAAKKLMATASVAGNISILVLGYDEI